MNEAIKTSPFCLDTGQSADAIVLSYLSPTGAWVAEWEPGESNAWPLTDEDGDYIPATPQQICKAVKLLHAAIESFVDRRLGFIDLKNAIR